MLGEPDLFGDDDREGLPAVADADTKARVAHGLRRLGTPCAEGPDGIQVAGRFGRAGLNLADPAPVRQDQHQRPGREEQQNSSSTRPAASLFPWTSASVPTRSKTIW